MEILVSAGMIIFAIAFFYLYVLASAILFCDAPVSLIGALFSFFCFNPFLFCVISIYKSLWLYIL